MGLVVRRVDSHLYSPSQIPDFIQDIEGDLRAAHDALKAGHNPGKRHAYCLFVDNLSGIMSIPTDPPYCLVYPTSYIKGIKADHFNTCNSPTGMHLHRSVCSATLQFSNYDPKLCTQYVGSRLILPHGVQYNNWLYPSILELQNHRGLLIDPTTGEPCPLEVVGDFTAMDPIFKGCYRDSFLPPHSLGDQWANPSKFNFSSSFSCLAATDKGSGLGSLPSEASISGDSSAGGTSDADKTCTTGLPFLRKIWLSDTFLTTKDTFLLPFLRWV